jgi:hypothetical protein
MVAPTLVDFDHVIKLQSRYESTGRRLRPMEGTRGKTTLRRQGHRVSMDAMVDRKEYVEAIHGRVARQGYEVDASAVAEAIVRRLLEGGLLVSTDRD